jgi:hypothetical protein
LSAENGSNGYKPGELEALETALARLKAAERRAVEENVKALQCLFDSWTRHDCLKLLSEIGVELAKIHSNGRAK